MDIFIIVILKNNENKESLSKRVNEDAGTSSVRAARKQRRGGMSRN